MKKRGYKIRSPWQIHEFTRRHFRNKAAKQARKKNRGN